MVNKRFLLDCMRRSGKADSENYTDQFKPWSHNDLEPIFHSDETVRFCNQPNRKNRLQSTGNKYKKTEKTNKKSLF